ncbi:hypothetical protein [Bacillus cereus]|uniref:hypothetical protein n=1 Tax=Bacillus cereus TaxID=1396 RepID=UPI002ABF9ED7|nr:hypothetical protein [Bacillus cereus]MDZ4466459.1 hypothetical protein [Bacillus cereus]MDZ4526660.1 hypothetical protein [Bacillus cereus]
MIGFLILLFIFVAGFFIVQMLIYRFAKKNIHKYTKIKWLHMNMKKGPRLDFFDFVIIVLVCIVWKIWLLPFI